MFALHRYHLVAMMSILSAVALSALPGIIEYSHAQSSVMGAEIPKTLHEAALKGHVSAVESLLTAGADSNGYDQSGLTPLHWAVYGENKAGGKSTSEYVAVIEMLLMNGANPNKIPKITPNTPFELQDTILSLAAKWCDDRIVAVLLKAGADPNLPALFTPLKYASWVGCPEIVRQLIQRGAYIEQKSNGETALDGIGRQLANEFYRDHVEVVKQLLTAGANPIRREGELRLALSNPQNRLVGRRWAKEILVLLQNAMEGQPQSGGMRSSGKISDRMN